ncbi:hypothetical protein N431DRAFT_449986 [Stipitochalara longipes BDJ]|nr:hypothetical protein N431DRAFT_449986 [Stipitochalara longipes BDJ]
MNREERVCFGNLTQESHHCTTHGSIRASCIQLCLFHLSLAPLWWHAVKKRIMSSGTSGSGWPPSTTPNYVDNEGEFASDTVFDYEGYDEYSDAAVPGYPAQANQQSYYPENYLPTTFGFPSNQSTSMVSTTTYPSNPQYSGSDWDPQRITASQGYQHQSP